MGSGANEPPKAAKQDGPYPHWTLKYFEYNHLPDNLQRVSKPFAELAMKIQEELPMNAESATAMRKLLEAKDCAVRAILG